MTIPEIKKEIATLEARLTGLYADLKAAEIGGRVAIGDLATNRSGETFKVTKIGTYSGDNSITLRGVKKLKSGAWGQQEKYIGILGYNCEISKERAA